MTVLPQSVNMTEFADKVWAALKTVPAGKVTTYQLLAKAIGQPRAFRAVGTVLHNNKQLIILPCHRVVKSDGGISGYAGGANKKIALLKKEGVTVKNNFVDLEQYLYTPKLLKI